MNISELQLQAKCWQWTWNTYPDTRRLLFHVPNGGTRNKAEASQLKASGVIAGIPDMPFIWGGKIYAFEFKVGRNGLSDVQKEVQRIWQENGVTWFTIYDQENFQSIFISIITKTRTSC